MEKLKIRRAAESDMDVINKLLYQVLKVHSDARPDLFKAGTKKYKDDELRAIIADDLRPIFVAEKDGEVVGYAFCVHQQYIDNNNTVMAHIGRLREKLKEPARHPKFVKTVWGVGYTVE